MPDNLPANAVQWTDIHGQAIETDDSGKHISNSIRAGKDFAGLQGQIWSETLRSDDLVKYITLPKLLIFAEKAWYKARWEVSYKDSGEVYNQTTGFFNEMMSTSQVKKWSVIANTLGQKELIKLALANIDNWVPTVDLYI